jgi:hypothetical protein
MGPAGPDASKAAVSIVSSAGPESSTMARADARASSNVNL